MKSLRASGTFVVTITALLGGTYLVASGATGPFHHPAPAVGSLESTRTLSITASGGSGPDSTDLAFNNLLPGAPQIVTLDYTNSGNTPESVWIVFPNATALSALNTLGQFGSVQLGSAGAGAVGDVFTSSKLNDNSSSCGSFSTTGCWPLANQYLLAGNFAPASSGSFSFRFEFATAYDTQPAPGSSGAWNLYPVPGQTTVNSSDGIGSGLPYELVALQPGITPGEPDIIHQRAPFGNRVGVSDSGGFSDQLNVELPQSPATYVVTSPDAHLRVDGDGRVTTVGGPLQPGTYAISGTDSNALGSIGTWRYTLTVTGAPNHDSHTHH